MAQQLCEFVKENWALVHSVYRGHGSSISCVLERLQDDTDPSIGHSDAVPLWIDLFGSRKTRQTLYSRDEGGEPPETLAEGSVYVVQASGFVFVLVLIDEDTAVYAGYYDSYESKTLPVDEAQALYAAYRAGDVAAIARFHGVSEQDLDIRDGKEYVSELTRYDITRVPDLFSLVETCYFSDGEEQESRREQLAEMAYNEFACIPSYEELRGKINDLLHEYYGLCLENFLRLERRVIRATQK